MPSRIEIRRRDDGTRLGYFSSYLEPDGVRQQLIAQGMGAATADARIYIPGINDPHETPFSHRRI